MKNIPRYMTEQAKRQPRLTIDRTHEPWSVVTGTMAVVAGAMVLMAIVGMALMVWQ